MARMLSLTVNGSQLSTDTDEDRPLLDVLREDFQLTGTKYGCGEGECGACTVIVDDQAINSCLYLAAEIDGRNLTTIEGLAAADGTLHPIQRSFVENGGIQCGFCSPGMILSAKALMDKIPNASEDEIKEAIAGNLYRCTGYVQIIDSIKAVSGHGDDEPHVVAFKSDEGDRGE